MTTGTKQIAIGDFMTGAMLKSASRIVLASKDPGEAVARIALESSRRLHAERGISFEIDASVVAQVLRSEPDRSLGARPLRRAFERLVESPLASEIVSGRLRRM